MIILVRVEKAILIIGYRINKVKKNIGKCLDSNPYLVLQNPLVLATVPWEPLVVLTTVSEFMARQEIRTRTYCLRLFVVTSLLRFILNKNKKAESSTEMGHFRRFFYSMFANCVHPTSAGLFTLLKVKLFLTKL